MSNIHPRYQSYIILLFSLMLLNYGRAQNPSSKTDSLLKKLNNSTEDSSKIKIFLEVGNANINTLPDTALYFYQQALTLATNKGIKKLMASSYRYIGSIYSAKGSYNKAIENFLKSKDIFKELADNLGMAKCFNAISSGSVMAVRLTL